LFALAYFLISLFPVMGFFNVYFFRYSYVADHFQYLASQGALTLAAVGIGWALARLGLWGRPGGNAFCALLLFGLATLTWRQGWKYADEKTLWRDTLARNPAAWMAHN